MDLQGPKIRVAGFKDEKKIELNIGDKFALDADMDETSGNQDGVGIAYKTLPQEVKVGNKPPPRRLIPFLSDKMYK
jgi:pyruvate kinase